MPIKHHKAPFAIKRKFHGGKMRVVHHPMKRARSCGLVSTYKDNQTSLTHSVVGGAYHKVTHQRTGDVMKRLEHALSHWSTSGSGQRHHMRGSGISTIR